MVISAALSPNREFDSPLHKVNDVELVPLVDVEQLMESVVIRVSGCERGLSERPADRKAWKNVRSRAS